MPYDVIVTAPGVLAQGDAESTGRESRDFDVVVLCAEEFQPARRGFSARTRVVYAPLDDSVLSPNEANIAEHAARVVARELAAGQRVLSTCMAGRNRSGLVSALALVRLYGCSGADAVRRVQLRRVQANALTNESFQRYLRRIPARPNSATIEQAW